MASPQAQDKKRQAIAMQRVKPKQEESLVSGSDDGKNSNHASKNISSDEERASSSDDGKSSCNESDDGKGTSPPHKVAAKTYRDFSQSVAEPKAPSPLIAQIASKEQTFPTKVHLILSDPRWSETIAWLPHGRSWRILQQKKFEKEVIPLYFRHGKYSSFARQVNGWGFRRITNGSDYNSYYHEVSTSLNDEHFERRSVMLKCRLHLFLH
jgi:hypothetical protein